VLHQLEVMKTAMLELSEHLKRRAERLCRLSAMVGSFDALNHRQRSLLEHAIHHPAEGQSIEGHSRSHRVHYMTARSDLADLEQRGFLVSKRVQKVKRYYPTPSLLESAARKP
jgi:Fic family protein